jgi:hypothetical protein
MSNSHHNQLVPVLGVDVGRVIIAPGAGPADTSFLNGSEEAALATPATEACFDALARLATAFDGRVWIVSKAGPRVAARTLRWFAHHRFFELTRIDPNQVRFCRERSQKRDHCLEHGITHFVDDRMDVLQHLLGLVPALFQFGVAWQQRAHPGVQPVPSWRSAERAILATL